VKESRLEAKKLRESKSFSRKGVGLQGDIMSLEEKIDLTNVRL
jgi:hypothetical protein